MDLEGRIERLRAHLLEVEAHALLVFKTSNVVYLTGMTDVFDEHADAVCVVTASETRLYTGFIYAGPARRAAEGTPWAVHEVRERMYESVVSVLEDEGPDVIALESSVPYGRFRFVSERFGGRVDVVDQWVEDLRVVKEPEEIDRIAAAASLADDGFAHIVERVRVGRSEREIALDVELFLRSNGSEGVAFDPIVASGSNSADPHARSGDRVVESGDFVKMDFGARIGGYCSDMTRTIVVGRAGERHREIYEAVLAANEAGIAAVRGGRRASEIDAAARDLLTGLGFGEEFGHGLGHGVGLDVHESPRVGIGSDDSVPSGAVITIEPGIYVAGFGGVRIEDLVVVGEDGARVLSGSPKELIEV